MSMRLTVQFPPHEGFDAVFEPIVDDGTVDRVQNDNAVVP